jgi:dolichol-phosphate mannosyltransferase
MTVDSTIKFSLVIPTYNERHNIELLIHLLNWYLETILFNQYELIIVDDDSPDGTWKIAKSLTTQYPHLKVIRRLTNRGLSTAVIDGWKAAQGDIFGVIDGDLQHPPEVLLKLWQAVEAGADLAVASRYKKGGGVSEWSLVRRLLSRGAQLLGILVLPKVISRVSDPMSGYFLVHRSCLENCQLNPLGYKILIEVLARGNIKRISEVPYIFQKRKNSESKVTARQSIEYILHLLRLRFT